MKTRIKPISLNFSFNIYIFKCGKCVSFQKFLIQNFISSLTKLAQSRSFKISSLSGGTNLAHTEMCIASHTCHWQILQHVC